MSMRGPRTTARSRTSSAPATPTTPISMKYGVRDWRGSGRASARETAMPRRRRRHRAESGAGPARARRAHPDRALRDRSPQLELGRDRQQPVLLSRCQDGAGLGRFPRPGAQGGLIGRRRHRGRGRGRAAGARRAALRQARPGHRLGADEHQRGEGGRDRRGLRRRRRSRARRMPTRCA